MFVGAATVDSIALVPRFPAPDERLVADELVFAGGGPAATAAVAASRLGVPAAFVGTVGDDDDGRRIRADLESEGVDVSGVSVARGQRSGASVIVVDHALGTRAICTRPGPLVEVEQAREAIRRAEWVHADHQGWPALTALTELTDGVSGRRLSLDIGYTVPGFSAAGSALFAPNLDALRAVYGERSTDALLSAALADGTRRVVATDGARGSFGADVDGERAHAPGVSVDVLSTLGAGDVFHGALVAAHVRGLSLQRSLEYANTVAALSSRGLDGRSTIPTHDDVDARLSAGIA